MGKSFLKFRIVRSLCKNVWPTRHLTPKQKVLFSKLRKQKLSSFGVHMMEKRTFSVLYGGLSGAHTKKLRKKAELFSGKTGQNFVFLLEQRLDSIVFRMNICSTFRAARQLVLHHKVYVNHQCVTIPSYQVHPGDIIRIAPDDPQTFQHFVSQAHSFFQTNQNSPKKLPRKPFHLEMNYQILQAIYLYPPQMVFYPCPLSYLGEPLTSKEFFQKTFHQKKYRKFSKKSEKVSKHFEKKKAKKSSQSSSNDPILWDL